MTRLEPVRKTERLSVPYLRREAEDQRARLGIGGVQRAGEEPERLLLLAASPSAGCSLSAYLVVWLEMTFMSPPNAEGIIYLDQRHGARSSRKLYRPGRASYDLWMVDRHGRVVEHLSRVPLPDYRSSNSSFMSSAGLWMARPPLQPDSQRDERVVVSMSRPDRLRNRDVRRLAAVVPDRRQRFRTCTA